MKGRIHPGVGLSLFVPPPKLSAVRRGELEHATDRGRDASVLCMRVLVSATPADAGRSVGWSA
jgi:hypothetical protein